MGLSSQGYGFSVPELTASNLDPEYKPDDECRGPDVSLAPADAPDQSVTISWEMRPTTADPNLWSFEVQRSESPGFRSEDDFDTLTTGRIGILEYEDCEVGFEDLFRSWYYRVVATSLENPAVQMISPVRRLRARPNETADLVLKDIRYRNSLLLSQVIGIPCAIYPVKTWGPRCGACYDEIMGRSSDSKCTECFRTTIQGGYYLPIPRYVRFSPAPKRVSLEIKGKEHRTFRSAMLEHDPILRPGDLIKDLETGILWDVSSVEPPTTLRGGIAHQNLVLYQLDRDDVEYQVPGNVTTETFCGFQLDEWHAILR